MSNDLEAGVNLEGAAHWIERLKGVVPGVGGFSGSYPLGEDDLIASTDGVGSKLRLAIALKRHDTIGVDLVATNVNDLLTTGAKPLFFLDYLALSKLEVDTLNQILLGITKGCEEAGCRLIGGETAQMPGLYREGEYEMAGFAVGIVKRAERVDGSRIESGDAIIGISSSGVHSNGFSLVRKIVGSRLQEQLGKRSVGEALLTPTRIYVKQIHRLMSQFTIKGMAHISTGGFEKNIPRALPKGLTARIHEGNWPRSEIFFYLQEIGGISDQEMRRVFNRGIGFVLVVAPSDAGRLCQTETDCFVIGEVVKGDSILWV